MNYRTEYLPEPLRVKRGRGRPQEAATAVYRGDALVAVFKMPGAARAYCMAQNAAACAGHEARSLSVGLKVGDRIRDNDPRMHKRVLTITAIGEDHVTATNLSGREFRILKRRIYTDGKRRTRGFSLEKPA